MTRPADAPPAMAAAAPVLVLTLALTAAVALRLVLAGPARATSAAGGVAFAAALAGASSWWHRGSSRRGRTGGPPWRSVGIGVVGAAALCAWPALHHLTSPGGALPLRAFPVWAVVVTGVAVAEEAFLRGALWSAVQQWRGEGMALLATTVVFAALHVPFYGVGVIPLDIAVGLLLGGLRQVSGDVVAPATAHVLADLAGWWLR